MKKAVHESSVGRWDAKLLDALEQEMETRVRSGCRSRTGEEQGVAEVVGYWMYRLRACRRGLRDV